MENIAGNPRDAVKSYEGVGAGTAFLEGLTGLGAVALAIIGLANVMPGILAPIATIALGAAFLFESGAVAARFEALVRESEQPPSSYARWGGMTTGFLAGVTGIALGILALLGITPLVLIPIAAIIFGSALIFDSGVNARLSALETEYSGLKGLSQEVARESSAASCGVQVLVGLGAVTLGILALVGISTMALSLVALLSVGSAILLSGSIVGTRMFSVLHKQ